MTVPPIVQTLTFLKRLNAYTGDVTVLFVSICGVSLHSCTPSHVSVSIVGLFPSPGGISCESHCGITRCKASLAIHKTSCRDLCNAFTSCFDLVWQYGVPIQTNIAWKQRHAGCFFSVCFFPLHLAGYKTWCAWKQRTKIASKESEMLSCIECLFFLLFFHLSTDLEEVQEYVIFFSK